MKERPILFSAPMVREILEGRKTQTRRVVKPIPQMVTEKNIVMWDGDAAALMRLLDKAGRTCPYGQPGDRLWVRETWYCDHVSLQRGPYLEVPGAKELLYYRATDCAPNGETYTGFAGETMRNPWRPALHMPGWASRITLEITGVRVERLQDISESDCCAEGCGSPITRDLKKPQFMALWESINGKGSWDKNPWVWVVEFKRSDA